MAEATTSQRKLGGNALAHFGGFLDENWRLNDILWGRLDTAEAERSEYGFLTAATRGRSSASWASASTMAARVTSAWGEKGRPVARLSSRASCSPTTLRATVVASLPSAKWYVSGAR